MKPLCILLTVFVLQACPANAASLYRSVREGAEQFEKQDFEGALQTFLAAQVEHPENARLKFDIASTQYKLGNFEEAAGGFQDVAATAQDAGLEAHALYNLGNTMYRQGKLEDAVEYYKKALDLDPEDEDARRNLEFVRDEIRRRMNEAKETKKRQREQQDQQNQQRQQDQQNQQRQQDQQGQQDQQAQQGQQGQQRQQDQQGPQSPQQGQSDQQAAQQQSAEDSGLSADAGRPMSEQEAEQWLKSLEENPDKLMELRRRSQPGSSRRPAKDW